MSEDVVEDIASLGVHHVQVSLDSHLSEVHDRSRGKKGAFERSVRGIERCRKVGMAVTVSMVAHQGNRDHYVDAVRYFRKQLGVRVLMDRVIRAGGELTAGVGLSTAEYFELISPLIKDGVGESKVCDSFVTNDFKVEPYCGVAHNFVYITAEGEMALCPTMTSRDNSMFKGPNIIETSLKGAWLESEYFTKYRGLNCRNTSRCPTAKQCGGGCRSNAYIETGELDSPDYLSCNLNKNSTRAFVDFASLYKRPRQIGSPGAATL
jgi:radical SAM protein with 4Fe4S-binding SPASM domain